jgi:26S proteasome regulatory subunit T1
MARIFSYAFTTAGSVHDGKADINRDLQPEISASRSTNIYGATNPFGEITGKGLRTGIGTIAGLGYGLPMSRLYAKYFGGSFDLVSMDGWGCDVYVKLRCLEEAGEAKP